MAEEIIYHPDSMRGIWAELLSFVRWKDKIAAATLEQCKPVEITTTGLITITTAGHLSCEKLASLADLLTQAWRDSMDKNSQPVRLSVGGEEI